MEKQQYSILIVEDQEIWISNLRELLEEEGYAIQVAPNKQKAEELLTNRNLTFDLVTMDMKLSETEPIRLAKGWPLLEVCAKLDPRPAIIVVSAANLERADARKLFKEFGIFDDISKDNFDFREFKETVREALAVKETTPAGTAKTVESLHRRLDAHLSNLNNLEEQKATFAKGEEPLHLLNQIDYEKGEIARLEAELRKFEKGPDHTDSD